jgi:hypothetical protein
VSRTALQQDLDHLDLAGVAVSAAIDERGGLHAVGGVFAKLLAAVRERSLSRIRTVVVSDEQPLDDSLGLVRDGLNAKILRDPGAEFQVLRAASLEEAVRLLAAEEETRWGSCGCALPPPCPDYAVRRRLEELVARFVRDNDSGYLALVGGLGTGRRTWLAHHLRSREAAGERPVYHLVDPNVPGSRRPEAVADCLYHRLRRKYLPPPRPGWEDLPEGERLRRLLQYLSEYELLPRRRPEVLYVGGADLLELGSGPPVRPRSAAPLLLDALGSLPRGVLCVFTSGTAPDWRLLGDRVTVVDLQQDGGDREDVAAYLRAGSAQLSPPLDDALIDQVVRQEEPPVFLTVARRLSQLRDPATAEAERTRLRGDPRL